MIEPVIVENPQPLSLYLHIPFCHVRCTYCAFNIATRAEDYIPAYVAAMAHELRLLGQATTAPIHTIYFGGGTPSLLSAEQISQIITTCREHFVVSPDAEISLEANPEGLSTAYLSALRTAGVNRLSIGMQSARPEDLRLFARQHDLNGVRQAMQAARAAGFTNVSLDLIYGAPGQSLASWQESVKAALAFGPDHLSLYALILEKGTALNRAIEKSWKARPDDDLAADMYELADRLVVGAGLAQYEISSWARPGAQARHNLQYWRNLPYLGVGAGAHGYAAGVRYEIVRPFKQYIKRANAQQTPFDFPLTGTVEHSEPIDQRTAMTEHMITGLRLLNEGVSIPAFQARFGIAIQAVFGPTLERLLEYGMLYDHEDSIRLARRARLISNQVLVYFMQESTAHSESPGAGSQSMFITFEGPEGSGKSTQVRLLAGHLASKGFDVVAVREPGGTAIGDQVRDVLHDMKNQEMHPHTELLLYSASRAQIVAQVIRPHLERGGIVICDRYADSTMAYQGYGRGLDLNALKQITQFATGGLAPDLTLYLDLEPEVGLNRRNASGEEWNRMDNQTIDFYRRVCEGYQNLISADPGRWVTIDASQSVDAISAAVINTIESRLNGHSPH